MRRGAPNVIFEWHRTGQLILDREGNLWHALRKGDDDDPVRRRLLGLIEEAPDLPETLESDYIECLDLWLDATDDRAEQLWNRE